jgi:hypothetical protein
MLDTRVLARLALLAVLLVPAAPALAEAPLYTNARLVSVDTRTRVMVVRNNDGKTERMRLGDLVRLPAGLRPGDEMILAVTRAPEMPRVSRVLRSVRQAPGLSAERTVARRSPPDERAAPEDETGAAREALNGQVGALAQQALYLDDLWIGFAEYCRPTLRGGSYDRNWFSLFESQTQVDLSSGYCRDLYNELVGRGENIKRAMNRAEENALRAGLYPGEVREARRRHALEWEGWRQPAPRLRSDVP